MPHVFLGDSLGARFPLTLLVVFSSRHMVHRARSRSSFPTAFDSSVPAPCPGSVSVLEATAWVRVTFPSLRDCHGA
jgi:hypothetical protein